MQFSATLRFNLCYDNRFPSWLQVPLPIPILHAAYPLVFFLFSTRSAEPVLHQMPSIFPFQNTRPPHSSPALSPNPIGAYPFLPSFLLLTTRKNPSPKLCDICSNRLHREKNPILWFDLNSEYELSRSISMDWRSSLYLFYSFACFLIEWMGNKRRRVCSFKYAFSSRRK